MICSDVLVLGQYPGSSVLDELQLSNALLWKETITIIHPAGDTGHEQVSPSLDWKQKI